MTLTGSKTIWLRERETRERERLGDTGIIPFSDCGEFAASLVSGVVSFMVEGRVGSVKG